MGVGPEIWRAFYICSAIQSGPRLLRTGGVAMTPETRERMNSLCRRIQEEQDPVTFCKLMNELNDLLAEKGDRLTATQKKPESNHANPNIPRPGA